MECLFHQTNQLNALLNIMTLNVLLVNTNRYIIFTISLFLGLEASTTKYTSIFLESQTENHKNSDKHVRLNLQIR